jgi:hypothetical protein
MMKEKVAVVSDHCIAVRRLVARPYFAAGKVRVMKRGGASWPKQAMR